MENITMTNATQIMRAVSVCPQVANRRLIADLRDRVQGIAVSALGIDGFGPDGVSAVSMQVGKGAGRLQTGFLYHYAFVMLLGVAAILSFALWAWNA